MRITDDDGTLFEGDPEAGDHYLMVRGADQRNAALRECGLRPNARMRPTPFSMERNAFYCFLDARGLVDWGERGVTVEP